MTAIYSLLSVVMIMAGHVAADTHGKIELIGVPIKAVVYGNSHGLAVPNPDGDGETFYIPYYSSTGSALVGYDLSAGKAVEVPLGSAGGYGLCEGADGALSVGGVNPGDMYRFDPATNELTNLGGSEHGNSYIWATAASPDGMKIYGACYPTAGVLEYDLAAGEMKWLGRMHEKEQYARSIEVDEKGKVWVGIGSRTDLIVLDPATGEKHSVLPDEYTGLPGSVNDLAGHGRYICASVFSAGVMLIYDSTTEQVVRTVKVGPLEAAWMNCRGGDEDAFYFWSYPGKSLYRYEPVEDELTELVASFGQCAHVVDHRYLHGMDDQEYVLYDIVEGKELVREKIAEARDGMGIMCLAASPEGHIFGPTYINMHLFGYNPETGGLHDLGKINKWGGQGDSITCGRDGKIYLGAYILATVNIYDPSKPWDFGDDAASNPRCLGPIGEGQYRTTCINHGPDGMLYVGSVPSYNSGPTGAFSRVNPQTGEKTVWTDLVPGGAVRDCTSNDRYVICAGGGKFFVFDPQSDEKVYEEDMPVTAMATAPSGEIVGTAGGEVFVFSTETMTFSARIEAPTGDVTDMTLAPNGMIYGINGKSIVEMKPADWTVRQIASEGGKCLAADTDSNLYFARGSRLYRFRWE